MKQKIQINIFKGMLGRWRSSGRRYIGARRIWLYCQDNQEKIPGDVLEVFTEGVRKYQEKYQKDKEFKKKQRLLIYGGVPDGYVIYKFVCVLVYRRKMAQYKALEMCEEFLKRKLDEKIEKSEDLMPGSVVLENLKKKRKKITTYSVTKSYKRTQEMVLKGEFMMDLKKSPWLKIENK